MNTSETIFEITKKTLITANIKDSLTLVNDLFKKNKIRHIPVIDDTKKLIGIISLTDIQRICIGGAFGGEPEMVNKAILEMMTIEQVMKKSQHTVQKNQSIRDVAEMLTKEEFHALPVVDVEKLVGIVTTTDMIKYLLDKCNAVTETIC
ncbi:MAG: hypothetical protein A3K10_03450 [Bacteroidetes bacterium RIFCSPLOWO2_12_FULL_31_6]|nr:MAG: hypothetical protein A3K10_03450 [Bacteroidetes bacterium RIFCSPLOWO2_12_FULL_31_6]